MRTVCKYTPNELFAGFGTTCTVLDGMAHDLDESDSMAHANLCGFGKTLIQTSLRGEAEPLLLVNCCDTMRRAYDVIVHAVTGPGGGKRPFTYLMELPHTCGPCQIEAFAHELKHLKDAYARTTGLTFDLAACQAAFAPRHAIEEPYVGIMGVRCGRELEQFIRRTFDMPVVNLTCTGNRSPHMDSAALGTDDEDAFFAAYAQALLGQIPCMRMHDTTGRRALFEDPRLRAVIYHCMKFCDFYGPEYAQVKRHSSLPLLRIESDFTLQSSEQLHTRIEAFAETITPKKDASAPKARSSGTTYVAGIDSGSTSTDVVILDEMGAVVASAIIPTGGGAQKSAEECLSHALAQAGISRTAIRSVVSTGYGRSYIDEGDDSVTEITCHAKGAHSIDPSVRTIIDIGGQDSKVIRIDEAGNVQDFAMNDKCAAGTGRFLEMMARALDLPLEEISRMGVDHKEDIVISSMCSVFAESEVVSLVAQNRAIPDIVWGIDNSVANKIGTLVRRVGGRESYMMTGGVAQNAGVVRAIERKLGCKVHVSKSAQLCGALGAALFALER